MGLKVSLNPAKPQGERRLELMEAFEADGPLGIDEVDHDRIEDVRWAWRSGILEVVAADPLLYALTPAGLKAVARAREARAELERETISTGAP